MRLACLVALVFSLLLSGPARVSAARSLTGTVTHVVDGDTISVLLDGRAVTVRYIGMDTPETRHPIRGTEPGGREAAAANRRLVLGKTVRLELDVREWDRYLRLLAYVYVGDVMINAELVRLGCAHALTVPPNVAHEQHFVRLEREAREARRGLWGHPACQAPQGARLREQRLGGGEGSRCEAAPEGCPRGVLAMGEPQPEARRADTEILASVSEPR